MTLELRPDPALGPRMEAEERARLASKRASLSPAELSALLAMPSTVRSMWTFGQVSRGLGAKNSELARDLATVDRVSAARILAPAAGELELTLGDARTAPARLRATVTGPARVLEEFPRY